MATRPENQELFEYGIHTESSDIRAHVCVLNKVLYVFQTRMGVEAIERENPVLKDASQDGVNGRTAEGWLVRTEWIGGLRRLRFSSWPDWGLFNEKLSTSDKGSLAVGCVIAAMKEGRFPFWIDAAEDDRENVQRSGTDILVFCKKKVQVKCDYRGGDRPLGTGNLFLQKAERNPLRRR